MANRSVSLDTKVFSINDLKREGSARLPPMYRGLSILLRLPAYFQTDGDQTFIMKEPWTWKRELTLQTRLLCLDSATHVVSRLRENEEAYRRYKIRPRILVNVDHVDTSAEIFGIKASNKDARLFHG